MASASTSPLMKPFEAWTELLYIVAMIPIHKPKRTKKKERKFINNQYVAKINLYLLNWCKQMQFREQKKPLIYLNGEKCWSFRLANIDTWKVSRVSEIYLTNLNKIIIYSDFLITIFTIPPTFTFQSKTAEYTPSKTSTHHLKNNSKITIQQIQCKKLTIWKQRK